MPVTTVVLEQQKRASTVVQFKQYVQAEVRALSYDQLSTRRRVEREGNNVSRKRAESATECARAARREQNNATASHN